ncbi:MAG TPA: hypothetical protein VHL78_05820 [Actinomycetota bacterium]|nr:hypothetical protein [Actinomycetota bacterium]
MATRADKRIAALYDLPPEEFIAARDRLARELRDAGDASAADVRKLRRPTLGAWVVNQLARNHGDELGELIAVGERLRAAQRAVIEGGSREALREAGNERRSLIDRLLDRAQQLLAERGSPVARGRLDGVEGSLMAATMSEEAAGEVRQGKLARELEAPAGFEAAGFGEVAPAAPPPARDRRAERLRAQAAEAAEEADAVEEEARRLENEAVQAERAARDARAAADRAADRAAKARRRAEDLHGRVQAD